MRDNSVVDQFYNLDFNRKYKSIISSFKLFQDTIVFKQSKKRILILKILDEYIVL